MSDILKGFKSPMIAEGMQATLSVFKNGGGVNDSSRQADMQEIDAIIKDYRDCMKRKAMCDATEKYAQSCVYKQRAIDCKRKASKLIAKYREKYGMTQSDSMEIDSFFRDENFESDNQMFFDGGQAVMLYNVVDEDGNFLLMGVTEKRIIEYANLVFYYDMKDSGESDINTFKDAIEAFESLDYMVEESKDNRMPSNFKDGGSIAEGNYKMVLSQAKEIHHHILELQKVLKKEKEIEAWVVGKIETISADLSTVTHYLEGKSEYEDGGSIDKLLEKKNEIEDLRDNKLSKFGNKISPKLTKKGINFGKKVRSTGELLGKAYLGARGVKADGGEMAIGGLVGKKVISEGTKYGKLAVKKAKPKAKKIVRKLKIGFNALAKKVAKSYEGKAVDPKYQKQYGKRYSKEEAKEVGNKVAAKVKRMKGM